MTIKPKPARETLATFIREQSDWRRRKAGEYPHDPRNPRSAEALARLADYIDGLPVDHISLAVLDSIQSGYGLDVYAPGKEAGRLISQYGYHVSPQDPERFLEEVAVTEAREGGAES